MFQKITFCKQNIYFSSKVASHYFTCFFRRFNNLLFYAMSYFIPSKNYKPTLNLQQTELGIKKIKDFFQSNLSAELRLRRVTAPLFVLCGIGLNADLNGTERAVNFPIKDPIRTRAEYSDGQKEFPECLRSSPKGQKESRNGSVALRRGKRSFPNASVALRRGKRSPEMAQ